MLELRSRASMTYIDILNVQHSIKYDGSFTADRDPLLHVLKI